jgi:hypothetical protein
MPHHLQVHQPRHHQPEGEQHHQANDHRPQPKARSVGFAVAQLGHR